MSEFIAKGTVLQKGTGGTPVVWTSIANIMSITPPNMQRDSLETTKHNDEDRWRTFIPGLIDPGQVTLNVTWDPAAPTHDFLEELNSSEVGAYRVKFPEDVGQAFSFEGFLESFEPTGEVDGLLSAALTYKVSGPVELEDID